MSAPTAASDDRDTRPTILLAVVLLAVAAGVWTAVTIRYALGLNVLVAAAIAAAAAAVARRGRGGRPGGWSVVWAVAGMAFAALPALRDDSWLHLYTTVAAVGFGSLAVTGAVGWRAMWARPFAVLKSLRAGVVWALGGLLRRVVRHDAVGPWIVGALYAGIAVLVFGGLLVSADAVVAELLDQVLRRIDPSADPVRFFLGACAFAFTLSAAFRAARARSAERAPTHRGVRTVEWALPLVVLNAVFVVFIFVQIAVVLFDGYQDVLHRKGINYADYARQGFFTLLVVTALTLGVVGIASRFGPARGERHRRLFEGLLGTLCALALAVVVAALHRLELYVEYSGLTRLRICAATLEIWLGVLFVLILATGPWARAARQLPRLAGATGAAILFTLGMLSPDALIARVGVERQSDTGVVDVRDLDGLSADAVPWLDKLPEPQRSCLLRPIARDLAHGHDAWYETNLARDRARALLADRPPLPGPACEEREYRDVSGY